MEQSPLDNGDLSDSEIEEYVQKSYEELKSGRHEIKFPNNAFTCPYCPNKKKDGYQHKQLLQHASAVGKTDSKKRSKTEKAKHIALVKYLENDTAKASGLLPTKDDVNHLSVSGHGHDEMFVWPWKGVIVNLPVQLINGAYVGKTGSNMRDEFTSRGFNPTKVQPLWDYCSHSAAAVIEFRNDWIGFNNAMSFEKAYKADHHGKNDWARENIPKLGIYGWVARADDYRSNTIIGELLRKNAEIKTVSDITAEEHLKSTYISHSTSVNGETASKYIEAKITINKLIAENNKLHQSYDEEIRMTKLTGQQNTKLKTELELQLSKTRSLAQEIEKLKGEMACQQKDVEQRTDELEKKANELEKRKGEMAYQQKDIEQRADELENRAAELEKRANELDKIAKELEERESQLDNERKSFHIANEMMAQNPSDSTTAHIDVFVEKLAEKEEELQNMDILNQTLIRNEHTGNFRLQSALKQLRNVRVPYPNLANTKLETQKQETELQHIELQKRLVLNEIERKKLSLEIEEIAARNSLLEIASDEQRKTDESVKKLAADQKGQKEKLHEKILVLEKQLDAKHSVELEIELLKGNLNVMKLMEDDDLEAMKKIEDMHKNLLLKEEELENLENLNQALVIIDQITYDELQNGRKELIKGLMDLPKAADIGVKRMGELDNKPFYDAIKHRYNESVAEDKASELCSFWKQYLQDPNWQPFKVAVVNGKTEVVIDENDGKLRVLKTLLGDEVYKAVTTALREMNAYNPSKRCVTEELWNFTEARKATLEEGISCLIATWNDQKSIVRNLRDILN